MICLQKLFKARVEGVYYFSFRTFGLAKFSNYISYVLQNDNVYYNEVGISKMYEQWPKNTKEDIQLCHLKIPSFDRLGFCFTESLAFL